MPTRISLSINEKDRLQTAMGQISYNEGHTYSWQMNYTEPLPTATGVYNGCDQYKHLFWAGLIYQMIDANI